jgi:hypothetical protein
LRQRRQCYDIHEGKPSVFHINQALFFNFLNKTCWRNRSLEPIPHNRRGSSSWLRIPLPALFFRRPHALPASLFTGTRI